MANLVYTRAETPIVFAPSGGQALFTTNNGTGANGVAAGEGKVSAQFDRGTAARPDRFQLEATFKFAAAPAINESCRLWVVQWDFLQPGNLGGADADLTDIDKLINLNTPHLYIRADQASNTLAMQAAMVFELTARYVQLVLWNDTSVDLNSTGADHSFQLVPVPPEIQ